MQSETSAACVACSGVLRFFGRRAGYDYYRCQSCTTLQLVPIPTPGELNKAYEEQYASAEHIPSNPELCCAAVRSHHEAIFRALKDYRVEGGIAEVGAGWGGLASIIVRSGYSYEGVEPSKEMAAYCQDCGLPVAQGDLTRLSGGPYAALVLSSVFEHLGDHERWLARANKVLRLGDLFVSAQPTSPFLIFASAPARWLRKNADLPQLHQGLCPPWHTVLFSIPGMKAISARHGFELVEVRAMPQGRGSGLVGVCQRSLEIVNRVGWALAGQRWPLVIGHLFVFRKISEE